MEEQQRARVLEVDVQMEAVGPVDALMVGGRMSFGQEQEQEQPRLAFELKCHSVSEESQSHCGCVHTEQRHYTRSVMYGGKSYRLDQTNYLRTMLA